MGIEPMTSSLPRMCSTPEPRGHKSDTIIIYGAGGRARTDDILLGRQMLYQLSYTRKKQKMVERGGFEPP